MSPARFLCAIPVRVCCSSALMHHCDVMIYTGDTFRSYDLVVMSHARCLCATPVKTGEPKVPRTPPLRGEGLSASSVNCELKCIPPTSFDLVSSGS